MPPESVGASTVVGSSASRVATASIHLHATGATATQEFAVDSTSTCCGLWRLVMVTVRSRLRQPATTPRRAPRQDAGSVPASQLSGTVSSLLEPGSETQLQLLVGMGGNRSPAIVGERPSACVVRPQPSSCPHTGVGVGVLPVIRAACAARPSSTQKRFPAGSARTTHPSCPVCPMSACEAPSANAAATASPWSSGLRSRWMAPGAAGRVAGWISNDGPFPSRSTESVRLGATS